MLSQDFLQTYSEIAIAIVGFSGVVVALKGSAASEKQKITLSMLILFGAVALVMGILPLIILEAGVDTNYIWRGLSAFIVLSQVVAGNIRRIQAKKLGTELSNLGGAGFIPIMYTSIIVAAANTYFGLFWLYMANLLLVLLAAIAIFRNLVGLGADA